MTVSITNRKSIFCNKCFVTDQIQLGVIKPIFPFHSVEYMINIEHFCLTFNINVQLPKSPRRQTSERDNRECLI